MSIHSRNIAIVKQTDQIQDSDLVEVAAALSKQATEDFGPSWGVPANVNYYADSKKIPLGTWPIIIMDDIKEPGAAGYHTDENGQPYALVQYADSWSVTVSHEMLEMLEDPLGKTLHAAKSIKPGEGNVRYLVEVADPCEDISYEIDGVDVSDFVTPYYYMAKGGVPYDHRNQIKHPKQILSGGYLSWLNAQGQWEQATFFSGTQPQIRTLGRPESKELALREWIDRETNKFKASLGND